MKRLFSAILTFCMLSLNAVPAFAACNCCCKDVAKNYWAASEIKNVVSTNIMTLDSTGKFNPEKSITRIEFVQSLLKVLANDNLNVSIKNSFSDVKTADSFYNDVLRSQQLGLVYGYPDGTFKPYNTLLRSEVTSIISHITKDKACNKAILNQFSDVNLIPSWALNSYAKTIEYGVYVNYPDAKALEPNRDLTRAEAAVLLSRLQNKLHLVKSEFKNEKVLGVEHLNVSKKAPVDTVTVTNLRNIISANNLLEVEYTDRFWTKTAKTGETVYFVANENIYTKEGTLVVPEGTKFVADVVEIIPPKMFNKNARVKFLFKSLVLPGGQEVKISAAPYTKDGYLKEGPWMTAGKILSWTVGLGAIGTGAGIGFSFIPNPAQIGTGIAIGTPIGCGVGFVVGLVTPGLHYRAKAGEGVLILMQEDTPLPKVAK